MSSKSLAIAGVVATVMFGIPAWWTLFIDHPETVTVLWVSAPVVMFALGAFTGWNMRAWADSRNGSRRGSRATSDETPSQIEDVDPLAILQPVEIPFLLRVYDESQVHVGSENLMVARNLRRKGAIVRADAPSSDFIEECCACVSDKWLPIMKNRADELRERQR